MTFFPKYFEVYWVLSFSSLCKHSETAIMSLCNSAVNISI